MSRDKSARASVEVQVVRVEGGQGGPRADHVAREEPLEIRLRGHALAVLMRTPGHDEELALGFVVTEGLVDRRHARFATHCRQVPPEARGNVINVHIPDHVAFDPASLARNFAASSSCGVCGKATLESLFVRSSPPRALARPLRVSEVAGAMDAMRGQQSVFERTGGLHAAALVDLRDGRVRAVREDIGRHNAVDKVIGHALGGKKLPLSDHLLVVSGRAGFEIVQKALVAGIPALASISAPSSMAVSLARAARMHLVGFVRGHNMNVYSGEELDHDELEGELNKN